MNSNKGFTLIELIFVVAIIGVMATIGLTMYQKQTETSKVDKAAMQMQLLAQSASAYYVNTGAWPELSNAGPVPAEFSNYLPYENNNNQFVDPWGHIYTARVEDDRTELWTIKVNNLDYDIGVRLAGRLPFAKIKDTQCQKNCELLMGVPIPGQFTGSGQSDVIIKRVGTGRLSFPINAAYTGVIIDELSREAIQLPNDCPQNFSPRIIHGLTSFSFGLIQMGNSFYPNTAPYVGRVGVSFSPTLNGFSSDMYLLKNTGRGNWNEVFRTLGRDVEISYLTMCVRDIVK